MFLNFIFGNGFQIVIIFIFSFIPLTFCWRFYLFSDFLCLAWWGYERTYRNIVENTEVFKNSPNTAINDLYLMSSLMKILIFIAIICFIHKHFINQIQFWIRTWIQTFFGGQLILYPSHFMLGGRHGPICPLWIQQWHINTLGVRNNVILIWLTQPWFDSPSHDLTSSRSSRLNWLSQIIWWPRTIQID